MPNDPPQLNVIIQAGGKGTRLEQYTWNKPKCLAPVDGKPLLFHSFDSFPGARFHVIADYKKDVVSRFLQVFRPGGDYEMVAVSGTSGNVAGIPEAIATIPPDAPVVLVWCDLKFNEPPAIEVGDSVAVGTTAAFPCRYRFTADGRLEQHRSDTDGVMGLFVFPRASMLASLPRAGELVDWLAGSGLPLVRHQIEQVKEIGTAEALLGQWSAANHARFFNSVEISADRVVKRARLPAFQSLLDGEVAWYHRAAELGFRNMPRLLAEEPLTLERIHGQHPFEMADTTRGRTGVLTNIMQRLSTLHGLAGAPALPAVAREVYLDKTLARLATIRALLPELVAVESFRVNGTRCRNVLHPTHADWLAALVEASLPDAFRFIHGDPTFSNMLVDAAGEPWFFDPRGKFGSNWFFGDANYDWAKLYYSVVGDYDNFNRRQFILEMDGNDVAVQIRSNGWTYLKGLFHDYCDGRMPAIRVLHGLIWLSLSGYVEDDYDSILAAFFNGLLILEDAAG